MLARHFLICLIALAAVPGVQTSVPAQPRVLIETSLSDDISLLRVTENPDDIAVQVYGPVWREREQNPRPLAGMAIQVWYLRSDGTALAQKGKAFSVQVHNGGGSWEVMALGFDRVSPEDSAGVVVSANGKLYVHEIRSNRDDADEVRQMPVRRSDGDATSTISLPPEPPGRILVAPSPLSADITALCVIEPVPGSGGQPYIQVRLNGQSVRLGERISKRLSGSRLQAWLLRKNGSVVAQAQRPKSFELTTADWITAGMSFDFPEVLTQELAGVVVSEDGKLYVREIKPS